MIGRFDEVYVMGVIVFIIAWEQNMYQILVAALVISALNVFAVFLSGGSEVARERNILCHG